MVFHNGAHRKLGNVMTFEELQRTLEALLFTASRPLTLKQLAAILPDAGASDLRRAVEALNQVYASSERVFRIEQVAGGMQMRTIAEYRSWVQKLEEVKTIKLSMPVLETLAIVAYKQPITRASVEFIRGVDSSHTLRTLMQRRLIRIVGREMLPGRPSLYGTTRTFLEVFGLSHLKHLPNLQELGMDTAQLELPLDPPDAPDAPEEAPSQK